jgi:hypothetical protein
MFLATATVTSIHSGNYLMAFANIAHCPVIAPRPHLTLTDCGNASSGYYYSGSLYLGIDKDLVASLRRADVVIMGNSRTQRTFASEAIERYFAQRGLRFFVLASEGSGFRFSQLILDRLNVKPRILMINNESFFVDVLEDTNREVVLNPDRFFPQLSAFYYAKKMQSWICNSSVPFLRGLYCESGNSAGWRDETNGVLYVTVDADPPGRVLVEVPPETRMEHMDLFMRNARAFLASPSAKDSCIIDYVIPSNNASVDLARSMAAAIDAPFVFPDLGKLGDLYSYDGSHLIVESSERWSAEFVNLVDPYVDACLSRRSPKVGEKPAS